MILHPDVLLGIELSAIISRNKWRRTPEEIIAELRATAGDRIDILRMEVGTYVGFFDQDHTQSVLIDALRAEFDGLEPWIAVGRLRASVPEHGTDGFAPPTRNLSGPTL